MKVLNELLKNKLFVAFLIAGIVIVLVVSLSYINKESTGSHDETNAKPTESFYPLGPERMNLEDIGAQRYNKFADTQDPLNPEGVVPFGQDGQKLIDGVLMTPTYEADVNKQKRGPTMNLRFDNPKMEMPLPDNPELRRRIRLCESVKTWDCNSFNNPEFEKYCGICIEGTGYDSKGKNFKFGGLYLDPQMKFELEQDARLAKKKPEYVPSVGKCPAKKFILTRPSCDYRKDRWECRNAQTISDAYAIDKCVQCQNPPTGKNTFVYVGTRNAKDTNYSLNKKPYYFTARLRLGLAYPNAKVRLVRSTLNQTLFPKFLNQQQCEFIIEKTTENEPMNLTVEYESYQPYRFTQNDNDAVTDMMTAKTPREDAMRAVCERNENRIFTNNRDNETIAYGCSNEVCCERLPAILNRRYAIVGQFESTNNPLRQTAFDMSILRINSLAVEPEKGPTRYGSVRGSPYFKDKVNGGLMSNIAGSRFWIWDKDFINRSKCEFAFVMPVSFLEATFPQDAGLCPTGPVIATQAAAERLETGACDKRINGQPQGPGTYTKECLQQIFVEAGCDKLGKGYPVTQGQINGMLYKNKQPVERDAITGDIEKAKTRADRPYIQGMDIKKMEEDNLYCYGKFEFNPCETAAKTTGPQSVECLDFLFRNAGKTTTGVGPTYHQSANRTSGTDRIPSKPVLYCQRIGKLSPMQPNGTPNLAAINKANSLGSVSNIRDFYDRIHRIANYSTIRDEQRKAMNDCYGVGVPREKGKSCGGVESGEVRYVRITHSQPQYLQISQVAVLDSKGKNIAQDRPASTTPSYPATRPYSLTDGILSMKNYPDCWISQQPGGGEIIIDLGNDSYVSSVVVYNRKDCCRERSIGTVVELLGKTKKSLAKKMLVGGDAEVVKFGAVSEETPQDSILEDEAIISLIPASSPGAMVMNLLGQLIVQANIPNNQLVNTKFKVFEQDTDEIQLITQGGTPVGGKVVVQGFRVLVLQDDNTEDFKRRSSWKVSDSLAKNPGEISFESISNPGFYLYINTVARSLGINNDISQTSQQTMSFATS